VKGRLEDFKNDLGLTEDDMKFLKLELKDRDDEDMFGFNKKTNQ
jgi:hypothetical protein